MNKYLSVIAVLSLSVHAQSKDVDYKDIFRAESHRIGSVVVRHMEFFSKPCLAVEALRQAPEWKVVSAKNICSFEGKLFAHEVADVQFESIYYAQDGIHFTLSITPLQLTGEQRSECVVPVKQGAIGDLFCGDPMTN